MSALDRVMEIGRAAYPAIAIAPERIASLIHERLRGEEAPDALAADEIYLAAACAGGDATALAAFERRYFASIPPALAPMSLGRDAIAEVEQILRIRLFVAEGDALPRVLEYAGQGQLGSLVRVAAVRAGLNLLRGSGRLERDDDGFEQLPIAADDPELAQLKAQHRGAFKAAFETAIATLDPRDRTLLRLRFVDGVAMDGVARIYAVHRATAARWLARARDELARAVQRALAARLGLEARSELDQLLPLVESQLELSLERLLRSSG